MAVATEVGVAHVVHEDDDEVGTVSCSGCAGQNGEENEDCWEQDFHGGKQECREVRVGQVEFPWAVDTLDPVASLVVMKLWFYCSLILGWFQVVEAVRVGEEAPAFTLKDLSGRSHKLSDYSGKVVVLEWVNHECPFVQKHYNSGNMQGLQTKYTGKDVVWFGIQTGDTNAKMLVALNKKLKVQASATLLDPAAHVAMVYGARTTPHIFIIGADGKLAYSGAVDDRPTPNPATITGARNYVSEALDAILVGNKVSIKATRPYGCGVKYKR